jgi:hypothetical protein
MKPRFILPLVGVLVSLAFLLWLGLQVRPASFPLGAASASQPKTVPLPAGLPAPVDRYFRILYGDQVPIIETAVIRGRAIIRPFLNIPFPARFVFVHRAGRDYRHYIETTWFGLPLLKVDEGHVDGHTFFESPMGTIRDDPNFEQGANLALWAEASFFPAIWVTDPRVQWQPVDDVTAILRVPFLEQTESFVVRFDPETHLLTTMEAMRYRDAGPGKHKILWITRSEPGAFIPGTKLSASGSAIWLDQGRPWAVFSVEELHYNVDVEQYIHLRGP